MDENRVRDLVEVLGVERKAPLLSERDERKSRPLPPWDRLPTIAAIRDTEDIERCSHEAWRPIPLRVKRGLVLVSVALAALGVWWYVTDPGVLSYQLGGLLTIPLGWLALEWLHRRLPIVWQWALAITLAFSGPVAYLLWPSSTLWNYGALAVMPLCILAWTRTAQPEQSGAGGMGELPWGPP